MNEQSRSLNTKMQARRVIWRSNREKNGGEESIGVNASEGEKDERDEKCIERGLTINDGRLNIYCVINKRIKKEIYLYIKLQ